MDYDNGLIKTFSFKPFGFAISSKITVQNKKITVQ